MASKWVIMVVHGVGETGAGSTIDNFLPSLSNARSGFRPDGVPEIHRLRDAPRSKHPKPTDPVPLFPVHVRRANGVWAGNGPKQLIIAEVFWSDLAGIREGLVGTVYSLVQTIFSLRFISDQASVMPEHDQAFWGVRRAARCLRAALYVSAFLLSGPIAAMTGLLSWVLVVDQLVMPRLEPFWGQYFQKELVVGVAGFLAWLTGTFSLQRAQRNNWSGVSCRFWRSFQVASLLMVLLVMVHAWLVPADTWERWRSTLSWWIGVEPIIKDPSALAYPTFLLACIQGVFLAVSLVAALGFVFWLYAWSFGPLHWKPGLSIAYAAGLTQILLWLLIIPPLAMLAIRTFVSDSEQLSRLNALLERIIDGFAGYLAFSFVLAILVYITWIRRARWVGRQTGSPAYPYPRGKDIIRLIVHKSILAVLIVVSALGCVLSPLVAFRIIPPRLVPSEVANMAIAVAIATLTVVLGYFRTGLRSGLHIITDVINHFYRRHDGFPRPWGPETPVNIHDFEIQQRIEHRFRQVLEHLLEDSEVTHLSIVAHSQGTIIAVDVLSLSSMDSVTSNRINTRLHTLKELHLVTMGSPLGHLYQHYFPGRYQPLDFAVWDGLKNRPNLRWVNVFRVDDYIGTFVKETRHPHRSAPPDPLREAQLPINVPIDAGGHTAYWCQPPVFDQATLGPSVPG